MPAEEVDEALPDPQMPAPRASAFGELPFAPNRGGEEVLAEVPAQDVQDQADPYNAAAPRRSTRLRDRPTAFMGEEVTPEQYESVYNAYMDKLNGYLPAEYVGELQEVVFSFSSNDRYISYANVVPIMEDRGTIRNEQGAVVDRLVLLWRNLLPHERGWSVP